MSLFEKDVSFGVASFLLVDMALIHVGLRLHGVLFSEVFEYFVLAISGFFAAKRLIQERGHLANGVVLNGFLAGFGGTLFVDVVLVDQVLELHEVHYPVWINLATGLVGLALAGIGVYRWQRPTVKRL